MSTVHLTAAQAIVRYLAAQQTAENLPFIAGIWAIFGHGNVAGLGEALYAARNELPTWRGHNEQAMAHAAIAYAKSLNRRRAMAVTTSIGPGATNLVTAAAVAHVNRLPVLLLPGDVFASRAPDPVLQQIEDIEDATVSANDCLRPVSRYFDRITRPEQLLTALPRAMSTLTDPVSCGPATLALCQDVQTEACDWPSPFFATKVWHNRRTRPDARELELAIQSVRQSRRPIIIAGGGVHYSEACETLRKFAERHNIPVAETQAGKSALRWDHPLNAGSIGVTGTSAANAIAQEADLVIAIGTRLQDFTTGSWALFKNPNCKFLAINVSSYDAGKHGAQPLVCDARCGLEELTTALGPYRAPASDAEPIAEWTAVVDAVTTPPQVANELPSDAQVIGAVQRSSDENTVIVCAAGGLPGELHKLWRAPRPNAYHLEYGYSCMGYEIAGGLGVKMALPDRDVVVMVGDGSYLMMNSEIATSVMLGLKLTIVLLDNRGFGCINRLQLATGGASFNNLLEHATQVAPPAIDYAAHAASMGARGIHVRAVSDLEIELVKAKRTNETTVLVIDTDPMLATGDGGHWWDVAVPEVSERNAVDVARRNYDKARVQQRPSG